MAQKIETVKPCDYSSLTINLALNFFNEKISTRAAFHEMLSVMIVNTKEMRRFFSINKILFDKTKIRTEEETNLLIEYISGLIVGTAVDKDILPFASIIKGTIDADRMDYLSRDSCTTKVPLAVDIGRLINKVTVVKLNDFQPSQVWEDHTSEDYPYQSMAIQYSAQRLVWQLSMARAIMYQSIYFHHKKLTAEAMFKRACEKIFSVISDCPFSEILSFTDQLFNEHFSKIMIPVEYLDSAECKMAEEILIRIRDRNLYKRVACLSQDVLDSVPNYIYESFVTEIIEDPFSEKYKEFLKLLGDEYDNVLKQLKRPSTIKAPVFMFIEANWRNEMSGDIPIDFGNAPYKMSSQLYKETSTLGEENRQKQYYLVTDQKDRDLVYVALEKVLFTFYKIKITEGAATCAKFTTELLEKTKYKLFELDYYKECLSLLSDSIVKKLYDSNKFKKVVKKYQTFNGVNKSMVDEQTLFSFLKQFLLTKSDKKEIEDLLDGVLELLINATYIDRNFFSKKMGSLMKKVKDMGYKDNLLVKLGGSFDSSNRYLYYINDITEKNQFRYVESFSDALRVYNSDCCIMFFDDGAYSGKQVVSIFQELMGIPKEQRDTDEEHTSELDEECKKIIKKAKIILAYICFNPQSQENIFNKLSELGISNIEIIFENDLSEKIFSERSGVFSNDEQRIIVEKKLREIGYSVQKSSKITENGEYKRNWDEKRVKEASLGYNDAQQMVIFEFNCPTYTLTPFWQNGKYENNVWRGLFQRTEK